MESLQIRIAGEIVTKRRVRYPVIIRGRLQWRHKDLGVTKQKLDSVLSLPGMGLADRTLDLGLAELHASTHGNLLTLRATVMDGLVEIGRKSISLSSSGFPRWEIDAAARGVRLVATVELLAG